MGVESRGETRGKRGDAKMQKEKDAWRNQKEKKMIERREKRGKDNRNRTETERETEAQKGRDSVGQGDR